MMDPYSSLNVPIQTNKKNSIADFRRHPSSCFFCWSLESKLIDCMVEPLKQRDDNEEANKRSLVKPKQPTKTNKQTNKNSCF